MNDNHERPTPRAVIRQAEELRAEASKLLRRLDSFDDQLKRGFEKEYARLIKERLEQMQLEELEETTEGKLPLETFKSAGFHTVADIIFADFDYLMSIPGVTKWNVKHIKAAALFKAESLADVPQISFDDKLRPQFQTDLLASLHQKDMSQGDEIPPKKRLKKILGFINENLDQLQLAPQPHHPHQENEEAKEKSQEAFRRLREFIVKPSTKRLHKEIMNAESRLNSTLHPEELWDDYISQPTKYNEILIECCGQGPENRASYGFLSEKDVRKIREFELDVSLMDSTLRGYQAFGAKFVLVQKRVILGDEMGLGKTIEALAVFAHLRRQGATHFFVVCPASVMTNWIREIKHHTRSEHGRRWRSCLGPVRQVHGQERNQQLELWNKFGGIGITTLDTLKSLKVPQNRFAAMVVDEAHFIKNPEAKRTRAVGPWLKQANIALLMSGTPMENRVDEFRTLVHHINPKLAGSIYSTEGMLGAGKFRKSVARVYLRRNQVDVLKELPPKIETSEWVSFEGPSAMVYREAVIVGNFMAMRQAAYLVEPSIDSPKLTRLCQLVEEAAANDRKIIVFSFFRKVIELVHSHLVPLSVGTITGNTKTEERQRLVDEFSHRDGPAVLIGQIEAMGVGLNIQAASMVILTEPQWKPSVEHQAIARSHRLGQELPVQVHRLLTTDSVDERMLEILDYKARIFEQYVGQSDLKDAAPESTDTTDDDLAGEIASQAELERQIIEMERKRLGIEAEDEN